MLETYTYNKFFKSKWKQASDLLSYLVKDYSVQEEWKSNKEIDRWKGKGKWP